MSWAGDTVSRSGGVGRLQRCLDGLKRGGEDVKIRCRNKGPLATDLPFAMGEDKRLNPGEQAVVQGRRLLDQR